MSSNLNSTNKVFPLHPDNNPKIHTKKYNFKINNFRNEIYAQPLNTKILKYKVKNPKYALKNHKDS